MNKHYTVGVWVTAALLATAGCGKSQAPEAALPDTITFTKPALYSEGVDYDTAGHRFLVTSLHEGVVGAVKADGSYEVVMQNPAMVSAIGIRIDAPRDRVLVCNSDPGASLLTKQETQGTLAGLAAYKLSTGELIKYVDLGGLAPGGHFCNDIAVAGDGTAYATDSFSPIIYKVDGSYTPTIFVNAPRFIGEGFNLNGIVIKDDYLLAAKYNEGLLFKFPLANPTQYTQVQVDQALTGADGLLWNSDGSLTVIANLATNKVFKLTSADNWASAKVVASSDMGETFPTTGVEVNGKLYVLQAMLHVLFNPKTEKHVEAFTIQRLQF